MVYFDDVSERHASPGVPGPAGRAFRGLESDTATAPVRDGALEASGGHALAGDSDRVDPEQVAELAAPGAESPSRSEHHKKEWTFLTNHALVLLSLAREPDQRLTEIGREVGLTERAVQRIVTELAQAGYLARERVGRNNRYKVTLDRPMRHPTAQRHDVGELFAILDRQHRR